MSKYLEEIYDMSSKIFDEDIQYIIDNDENILKKFKNKQILITGATGLIAHILILALLKANKKLNLNLHITALIRNEKKAKKIFQESFYSTSLGFITQDIRKKIKIDKNTDIDFIFHAAAVTDSQTLIHFPIESFNTQVEGTKNILELAERKNAKVLYFSSMEIYGQPFINGKATEKDLGYVDPLVIRNGYPEAKRASEFLGRAYSEKRNVQFISARLAQTFGAGVEKDDSRVFAQFIRSAMANEDLVLHTDGSSMGNYCYTRDVIEALLLLILNGKNGEAYNVVNEETNVSIKNMATLVSTNFGTGKVKIIIPEKSMGYATKVNLHLSGEKLRKLGWRPTYGLKEMFARTIESFRESEK